MGTSSTEALALLARGAITLKGRMPWSTNVTLLVELALDGVTAPAVYKPARGERALWDFPPGLWKRELAAYLLSEALGWGLGPPTVPRARPAGPGEGGEFPEDTSGHGSPGPLVGGCRDGRAGDDERNGRLRRA